MTNTATPAPDSAPYGCDECHENCQDDGYGYSDCCGAPLL